MSINVTPTLISETMETYPVELNRTEDRQIEIQWSDGLHQRISYRELRDACPCAACREPEENEPSNGLRVLSESETRPLEILGMKPVGNYAYNIQFSDDHNTGIFTFNLLRSLVPKKD